MAKFYEIVTDAHNLVVSGVPIKKGKIVELDPRQYTELVNGKIELIEIMSDKENEEIKALKTKVKTLEDENKTLKDSETKLKEEIKALKTKG